MDIHAYRSRYLKILVLSLIGIPILGIVFEEIFGVYSYAEYATILTGISIIFIVAVLLLTPFVIGTILTRILQNFHAAYQQNDDVNVHRYARQLNRLNWYVVGFILIYTQAGPFTANLELALSGVRILNPQEQLLSYVGALPPILITLFLMILSMSDLLGKFLGQRNVVIPALPMRYKIMLLGIFTPLLIDITIILYYSNITGYFGNDTILLWSIMIAIAIAGTFFANRSFHNAMLPLQGPLRSRHNIEALHDINIFPHSLDEMGELAQGWQNLLHELQNYQTRLQQERNFSQTLINNANAIFIVLDNSGSIIQFNKGCEKVTGYKADEVLGKKVWDYFILPEEVAGVRAIFDDLMSNPIRNNYQNYWLTKDGGRRLIDWSNSSIRDEQGQVKFLIAIGIDISDRKLIEEELRRSKDTLDRAQAIAHIGHWDWNMESNDLVWSDEIFRIFGLTPQQFEATYPAFLEHIHPDDRENVIQAVNKSVADENFPYSIEHRVVRPNGDIRIVHERGEVYRDPHGNPQRMVGTVHDITEQRRVEQAVRDNERMYRQVFDASEDAIFILDGENIFDANTASLRMFDAPDKASILSQQPWELSPPLQPDGRPSLKKSLEMIKLGQEKHFHRFEWLHRRMNGEIFPAEVTLTTTQMAGKPVIHGVVRDITEKKLAEQEVLSLNTELELRVQQRTQDLEQANAHLARSLDELKQTQKHLVESEKLAALGGLVAGIAHEINTPLGISVTAASHLQMKIDQYQKRYEQGGLTKREFESLLKAARDSSSILGSNLNRASDLIRSFKQIAVDQSSEKPRVVNLYDYVDEIINSLNPQLRLGDFHIHNDTLPSLQVHSYPGAISQITTNLILNSLIHGFHGLEGGDIWIKFQLQGNDIVMTYKDNGVGIDQQYIDKIFDPFFTTNREQGGSGLGLNIVYNIVTQTLAGKVDVKNEVGQGVTFTIRFPGLGDHHVEH